MTTQTTQVDQQKPAELESVLKWLDVPGATVPAPADPEIDGQAEQVVGHLLTVDPKDAEAISRGVSINACTSRPSSWLDSVPRARPTAIDSAASAESCAVNALVDATPISGPASVGSRASASRQIVDSGTFTTASVFSFCSLQ